MGSQNNSDDYDTYSIEEHYDEKVTEVSCGFTSGIHTVRSVGGYYRCTFCRGKMPRNWSLLELLNHATGQSTRGNGLKGPQHKVLADYIVTSSTMTRDRELGRVGDCGGNRVVQAGRNHVHRVNRAKAERRKNKRLAQYRLPGPKHRGDGAGGAGPVQ